MRITAVFTGVLILALASCASTRSAGTTGSGAAAGGSGSAAGIEAAQKGPVSFLTKELVYFATGSAGAYSAGTLDEYTVFDWDPAFTRVLKETRYSASDSALEIIEYAYEGDRLSGKTTKIIVANEKGVEQEQVRTQVEYQYAQNRLQKEMLRNSGGVVVSAYEYAYDAQGNRVGRVMKNGKDAVMAETVYSYTGGRLVSAETKSAGGTRISSIEYQYDRQGNLIRQETQNASGKTTSALTISWQNGLEMKNELIGADNTPQQRETNQYGPGGNLIAKTIENLQGKSVQIMQYEYSGGTAGR